MAKKTRDKSRDNTFALLLPKTSKTRLKGIEESKCSYNTWYSDEVEASALISTSVLQIQIVIIDNFIKKDLQEKFSQDWSDHIY